MATSDDGEICPIFDEYRSDHCHSTGLYLFVCSLQVINIFVCKVSVEADRNGVRTKSFHKISHCCYLYFSIYNMVSYCDTIIQSTLLKQLLFGSTYISLFSYTVLFTVIAGPIMSYVESSGL